MGNSKQMAKSMRLLEFSPCNLLRVQPNEDWQRHFVMLLSSTLLSLLFLTFL